MDTGTSVERQLYILSLLAQSKKGYTLSEIIDHLKRVGVEATRRMVARDMDSISRNFYVYEEEVDGVTVYKADRYAVTGMDFTMPQIIALYYVKEMLKENSSLNIAGEAAQIVDALLAQMPELSKAALADLETMIKIVPASPSQEKDIDEGILEDMRIAAQKGLSVDLEYTPLMSGETQERRFDPYVLEVRDGCWHAIGFCHLRGSVRDLRISRIGSAVLTNEKFAVPPGFYENYKKTRFDKLAGENSYEIEVEFTGPAATLVEEYHAAKADRLRRDGGRVLFYKKAALTPDLVQWLLSFGADARVRKPKELRERIAAEAEKIVELYRKESQQ